VAWLLVENWVYGTSVRKILRSSCDVDAGEMPVDGREGLLGCKPDARHKLASCRALQLALPKSLLVSFDTRRRMGQACVPLPSSPFPIASFSAFSIRSLPYTYSWMHGFSSAPTASLELFSLPTSLLPALPPHPGHDISTTKTNTRGFTRPTVREAHGYHPPIVRSMTRHRL